MTEAETVDLLETLLLAGEAFVHTRFGDGDVFFATGTGPVLTADGEEWTPELSTYLMAAWLIVVLHPSVMVGDVETYLVSDGCEAEWRMMLANATRARGVEPTLVAIEALRASVGYALPFYRALARDVRRKAYVAPSGLAGAARMLGADHVEVPLRTAFTVCRPHGPVHQRIVHGDYEIVMFSAGRGGHVLQGDLSAARPEITQIDIGSGLDVLFTGLRRGTDGAVDVESLRSEYRAAGLDL